jgi:hypothetical protein
MTEQEQAIFERIKKNLINDFDTVNQSKRVDAIVATIARESALIRSEFQYTNDA